MICLAKIWPSIRIGSELVNQLKFYVKVNWLNWPVPPWGRESRADACKQI